MTVSIEAPDPSPITTAFMLSPGFNLVWRQLRTCAGLWQAAEKRSLKLELRT